MTKDKETKNKILNAGKKEFLEKGFKDASLRNIASLAGVTTGAIYGYYTDKNELFSDLVNPAADKLIEDFIRVHDSFKKMEGKRQAKVMHDYSSDALESMLRYIYDNYDAFKLIACSSVGTGYEAYIHDMVMIEAESTKSFINSLKKDGIQVNEVSDNLCHILSNAYINSIFEVVIHDMPWDEAKDYVESLTSFFSEGWDKLLDIKE